MHYPCVTSGLAIESFAWSYIYVSAAESYPSLTFPDNERFDPLEVEIDHRGLESRRVWVVAPLTTPIPETFTPSCRIQGGHAPQCLIV